MYPLIKRLRVEDRRDREKFRRKLRLGIIAMLRFIMKKADETMQAMTLDGEMYACITQLSVTIPAQWNLDFREGLLGADSGGVRLGHQLRTRPCNLLLPAGGPRLLPPIQPRISKCAAHTGRRLPSSSLSIHGLWRN